jgi:NAD(P)-dependent dehydrogenase (short-subunit alcohol dehydrogenase family)
VGGLLQQKVALITGGSTGIGRATAERFVQEGAFVFITGRREAELAAAARQIGSNIEIIVADSARVSDLDRVFATVAQSRGRIDVLHVNAGIAEATPIGQLTEAHFDRVFGVNIRGALFTVQKALPLMGAGGTIILTGSTTSGMGTPGMSVYSAAKAGVRNVVRSLMLDLIGTGIRINVLTPGPTETPALVGIAPPEERQALLADFAKQIPLGRVGRPDELAAAAVFLASEMSSFVNGTELIVDGGFAQSGWSFGGGESSFFSKRG